MLNSNLKYQKFTCFSEESGNHGWACNIEVSGYTPIMYSLIHGGSSSVICGAENFNNTTISGYASIGNLEIIVNVLYLKTKS